MTTSRSLAPALLAPLLAAACAHLPPPPVPEPGASIELVESPPVETTLDHPDIRNAHEVWLEMVQGAKRSLDFAEFYLSDAPPSRLTPVIAAIRTAAERKVRVRLVVDGGFALKYPETLQQLEGQKGIEVRRLDAKKRMGGIQHAKYFIVDGTEAYLGSQNFDWRLLEHVQEMGVRLRSKLLAGQLQDVFDTDLELATGADDSYRIRRHAWAPVRLASGEVVTLVASPGGWLPREEEWDLPWLVRMIDGARSEAVVQLLTYSAINFDGSAFPELDAALRRAAARGVKVRLLVSDWSDKPASRNRTASTALAKARVEVRVIKIPEWSGGAIPFARVAHAKYLVVDGQRAWVGTSNWEGDYFLKSRNVGVVVEGALFAQRLARVFDDGWESPYATPLRPLGAAEMPKAGRPDEEQY